MVHYFYTSDNGEQFLTSFRHYKDKDGKPFVDLPNCIRERQTQKAKKWVFWGNSKDRRRGEIKVINPENKTGETNTFLPIPQRPLEGTKECYLDIFNLLKDKYADNQGSWCLNYRGETRYTPVLPQRLRDIDNVEQSF